MVTQTAEFSVVYVVNRIVFGCAAIVSDMLNSYGRQ